MAESQGSNLFADCIFAIVTSKDLDVEAALNLRETLTNNGGEVLDLSNDVDIQVVTHIISATSDFPKYNLTRECMIPVLTPSWITNSLLRGKPAQFRPFTPDPKLFFSNLVLSCADIPSGDKDAITGAVLALGGMESSNLTRQVTHICALTMDHPKCQSVADNNLKCHIVLPHWFDDCLKLGKRIDETPYLLPDPEILRVKPEEPLPFPAVEQIRGAISPHPRESPIPNHVAVREFSVFKDKKVMIASDLELGSQLRRNLEDLVVNGSGQVTNSVYRADIYVCRWREGRDYVIASRAGIDVGNLAWFYYLITTDSWTSPLRRLLHYPIPRGGLPQFRGSKITLSNYGGESRTYLENLITASGGEFTKTLRMENTLLITARKNSEKCVAAKEWKIATVNHLWLEESYARCEMLPYTYDHYTTFPPRTNLGEVVGQTKFDEKVLEHMYFNRDPTPSPGDMKPAKRKVMVEKDRNSAQSSQISSNVPEPDQHEQPSVKKATAPRRKAQSLPGLNASTPAPNRRFSTEKENDTPSTTNSRSAKAKAVSRLHGLAPDIALYEKEKKRKGSIWGGDRAANRTEHELLLQRSSSPSTKRESETEFSEDEKAKPSKRARTGTSVLPPVAMRLMVTGHQDWSMYPNRADVDKKKLREMGALIVSDPATCTHLAAPAIVRTQKFLSALANGPVVISTDFIEACIKAGQLLDPAKFPLQDPENEKKWGVTIKDVISRAKANKKGLLRLVLVYSTEEIPNGPDTYRKIAEMNGGTFNVYRGKPIIRKTAPEDDVGPAEPVYLLSGTSPAERKLWPKFTEMAKEGNMVPRIVQTDWLLDVALSQTLKWKKVYLCEKQ